jgi:hypothetical protein
MTGKQFSSAIFGPLTILLVLGITLTAAISWI